MAALYELANELQNFSLVVDDETGEITNLDELDALIMERDTKVENIALWVKNLTAEAKAVKEESDKLAKRASAAKNKADRLKAYLGENLAGEKFSTPRVAISYRRTKAVSITSMAEIPERFTRLEIKADKAEIKKAIDAGESVPGAEIEERTSVQIR